MLYIAQNYIQPSPSQPSFSSVLTDGEVWDKDLFKYVEKETEKGDEFGF